MLVDEKDNTLSEDEKIAETSDKFFENIISFGRCFDDTRPYYSCY